MEGLRRLLGRSRRDAVVDGISIALCLSATTVSSFNADVIDIWFALRILVVLLASRGLTGNDHVDGRNDPK